MHVVLMEKTQDKVAVRLGKMATLGMVQNLNGIINMGQWKNGMPRMTEHLGEF